MRIVGSRRFRSNGTGTLGGWSQTFLLLHSDSWWDTPGWNRQARPVAGGLYLRHQTSAGYPWRRKWSRESSKKKTEAENGTDGVCHVCLQMGLRKDLQLPTVIEIVLEIGVWKKTVPWSLKKNWEVGQSMGFPECFKVVCGGRGGVQGRSEPPGVETVPWREELHSPFQYVLYHIYLTCL